jgi:hypothetical protein
MSLIHSLLSCTLLSVSSLFLHLSFYIHFISPPLYLCTSLLLYISRSFHPPFDISRPKHQTLNLAHILHRPASVDLGRSTKIKWADSPPAVRSSTPDGPIVSRGHEEEGLATLQPFSAVGSDLKMTWRRWNGGKTIGPQKSSAQVQFKPFFITTRTLCFLRFVGFEGLQLKVGGV